jgi:hypothetical protein
MTEIGNEQRGFTRVELALPVQVHQQGRIWHQRLIDLSLNGVSTDLPDGWDARHNEPFTLMINLDEDSTLVLHADLQYVEAGKLGFSVPHVDRENIEPLRAVMEAHLDIYQLEEELNRAGLGG